MILSILVGMIVTFLVVVTVHELGHYFAARIVGVETSVFSIGFGKVLWSKTDKRATRWQLAAIPLGGYCRFVGDENAASLSQSATGQVIPGSLRAASLAARAFVVVAGPAANVALALGLLYSAHLFDQTTSWPLTVQAVHQTSSDGLRVGDQILAANDRPVQQGDPFETAFRIEDDQSAVVFDVLRDGDTISVTAAGYFAPVVGSVIEGSAASESGVEIGDQILAIDHTPVIGWADVQKLLSIKDDGTPKTALLSVNRGGDMVSLPLTLSDASQGRYTLGVRGTPALSLQTQGKPLSDALRASAAQLVEFFSGAVAGLTKTIFGFGDMCKLTGPVGIASLSGQALALGPFVFLQFAGVISASLALMNLLPIPGLDGGHLAGYGMERLTGKEPSNLVKKITFIAGVTLISYLVIMATVSDILC